MQTDVLKGKVAVVTGAGRGIGREIALALARCGVKVVLAARSAGELEAVAAEVAAHGGEALACPADVTREGDIRRLLETTVARFGRLDILVNNAAMVIREPLETTSTEHWDEIMALNARAMFLLCREALPLLRRQERSDVVNIGSVLALRGYVNQGAYTASKHAMLGMTKTFAREAQPDGVRFHAIHPGGVDTDMRPDIERSLLMHAAAVADAVVFVLSLRGNAVIDEITLRRDAATPWG
ncbi:MAG TPA: SDR family oxidoreductase [Phycisphaerae bacterium]|nr:SDR family oxidoreductase [Phycisphaerae bacterium]